MNGDGLTRAFWRELAGIRFDVAAGPGRGLRWGAAAGGHDDLVMSLALVGALEGMELGERVGRGRSYLE